MDNWTLLLRIKNRLHMIISVSNESPPNLAIVQKIRLGGVSLGQQAFRLPSMTIIIASEHFSKIATPPFRTREITTILVPIHVRYGGDEIVDNRAYLLRIKNRLHMFISVYE